MTAPHIRNIATSLQRQMARPGGVTLAEAVARAEQGLEAQRERTMLILQANVDALAALCAARADGADGDVYALASALVDMAGFLEIPPFYAAAYSLCEAAHRMAAAEQWSWPSVEVHVRALSLILADDGRPGAATDQLLAGLRAVVAHIPRAG
ncbi:hypothetical protein [Brevundimonas sp.]|jgi:hypothetical protein|uniref:hypothetical protein n=1 Tax=Brevundimonas sp. TaxID=1871086 RepID=UPI0037C0DD68